MRYLVKVFYDGSNYFGYQRQPEHKTIEGAIIKALEKTNYIENTEQSNFKSASRTDKKVSAIGNTFAFNTEKKIILEQLNAEFSRDKSILAWAYSEVEEGFTPKYSNWKKYWYIVPLDFIVNIKKHSIDKIKELGSYFIGEHDFRLFCKTDHRKTIREIQEFNLINFNSVLILEFKAQSFLWEQVRRIVSYILNYEVLPKKMQNIKLLLSAPKGIKNLNLESANPNNLILVEHKYENLNWTINEKATEVIQKKLSDNIMKLRYSLSVNSAMKHFFQIQ